MNVSITGLIGPQHAALSGIITTGEVKTSRCHIKMLCGDYLTYEKKSNQSGGSPHCRVCGDKTKIEKCSHILTSCSAYEELRNRKVQELENLSSNVNKTFDFQEIRSNDIDLTQFLLDPTSINLKQRINPSDPLLSKFFSISRSYCNLVNTRRINILKTEQKNQE